MDELFSLGLEMLESGQAEVALTAIGLPTAAAGIYVAKKFGAVELLKDRFGKGKKNAEAENS
jgi:hypothetical protein